MSMEAGAIDCLGSPAEIADTAVREFRRRRNLLAHSWLAFCTFVLLPLPLWLISWALTLVALCKSLEWSGLIPATEMMARDVTLVQIVATQCVMIVAAVVPSAILVTLFARFAARTRRPLFWGLIACALVVIATAYESYGVRLEQPPGSRFYFGPLVYGGHRAAQFLQCLVPLLVGVLVLRRGANVSAETRT